MDGIVRAVKQVDSKARVSLVMINLLLPSLAAIALHESGHIAAAKSLGLHVKRLGISWRGPYIVRESGTGQQNIVVSAAGPLANVLCIIIVMSVPHWGNSAMSAAKFLSVMRPWRFTICFRYLGPMGTVSHT